MMRTVHSTQMGGTPVAAPSVALGVDLIPRVRPLSQGGLSDLLALRRRHRRQRAA